MATGSQTPLKARWKRWKFIAIKKVSLLYWGSEDGPSSLLKAIPSFPLLYAQ